MATPYYLKETEFVRSLVWSDDKRLDISNIDIATGNGKRCETNVSRELEYSARGLCDEAYKGPSSSGARSTPVIGAASPSWSAIQPRAGRDEGQRPTFVIRNTDWSAIAAVH